MHRPDATDLSALLLPLYRSARELPVEQFQSWALNRLKPQVSFDAAWWGSGVATSAAGLAVHTIHLHNLPPEILPKYAEVAHQDTPTFVGLERGTGIYRFHMPTIFAAKDKAGIRAFNRSIRNEHAMLCGTVDRATGFTQWMTLIRTDPNADFWDHEKELMGLLLPHMLEALAINRARHLEQYGERPTAKPRYGLAIADRLGFVYHADVKFAELLRDVCPGPTAHLPQRLVAGLLDRGRYVAGSVLFEVSRSADLLFLRARWVMPVDDLSPRERAIAQQIAQGRTHKEIAQALFLAPSTVRTHIQRIHEKLGCRNAAELIAQLDFVC